MRSAVAGNFSSAAISEVKCGEPLPRVQALQRLVRAGLPAGEARVACLVGPVSEALSEMYNVTERPHTPNWLQSQ